MATDISLLMGEITEEPNLNHQDSEKLLLGFLKSLLEEQKLSVSFSTLLQTNHEQDVVKK